MTGRVIGVAGLAFAALSIAGIATVGRVPAPDAATPVVDVWLHVHRSAVLRTDMLLSLANGALLVFFAYLASSLRGDEHRALELLTNAGAVLLCAIGAATAALPAAAAYFGTVAPDIERVLLGVYFVANAFSAMPAALAVGTIALAAHLARAFPRWLIVASGAAAGAQLLATLTLLGHGATGPAGRLATTAVFGSLTLWTAVVSVRSLLLRPDRCATRLASPATHTG